MTRYRVTTPDTARAPGVAYADFQAAQEYISPVCMRHLIVAIVRASENQADTL